jgi:hypothetical protein
MSLELNYEALDGYIQQIATGKKLVYIGDKDDVEKPLIFVYPSTDDLLLADIVYKESLCEAKRLGLPSMEDMELIIQKRRMYTEEDEAKIAKLRSRIEGQQVVLSKTTRVPARRDRIKGNIRTLQEQIAEIESKKEIALSLTQERKATEKKFLFLTRAGTVNPQTKALFWETLKEFDNEADYVFRKKVFLDYIVFMHGLPQEISRYVSRNNLWRIRYVTALKTSDQLFGCAIGEYNIDQVTLLYWSHFYQSIYEMMPDDRPSDEIIEDDQALDAYMKDWHAERSRDATASQANNKKKYGNNSAWDHQETLIMQSNPIHGDVEYSDTMAERAVNAGDNTADAAAIGRESRKTALTKAREKSSKKSH